MNEDNCLFCKIITKQIPSNIVYEDDNFLGFLDINPRSKGHTMVIPKNHTKDIFSIRDEEIQSILPTVRKVMRLLHKKLASDSFNVGWNNGEIAGQEVNHLHIHILPRYKSDGGGAMQSIINNPGTMSVKEIAKLIKS